MNIYIIGNEVVPGDNLPFTLIPWIEKAFPGHSVIIADPTDQFIPENGSILIDSVEGIEVPRVYKDVSAFVEGRSVSVHDYDLGYHLLLLKKLHLLSDITIIGIPRFSKQDVVKEKMISLIRSVVIRKTGRMQG
jgi:hypothetical protein